LGKRSPARPLRRTLTPLGWPDYARAEVLPARTSWTVIATIAVLIAGTGCGGSDGSEGGDGGDDERSAVRDIQPEAQEQAEAIVLELSDFPNGWRASPSEEVDDRISEFRECMGVDFSGVTITGEAKSQDFAMGESAQASSEARVLETDQDAADAVTEFARGMASDVAEDCVTDLIVRAFQEQDADEDIEIGEVDVGELSFTPPDIEEGRAWQIAVPIEVQGLSPTVYLDFVMLREGDAVAQLETEDVSDPFDPALRDDLLEALAARMSKVSN
jgi:hypothetical protein